MVPCMTTNNTRVTAAKKLPAKPSASTPSIPDDLTQYTIKELETLALELYEKYLKAARCLEIDHQLPDKDILNCIENAPLLHDILQARKRRLNANFKFTPKNISRFIKINDMLADRFKKARREARPLMKKLEQRIKDKDSFLNDYEIEMQIKPIIATKTVFMQPEFYEVLEDVIYHRRRCLIRNRSALRSYFRDDEYSAPDHRNWAKHTVVLGDVFAKHHICFLMHELCEHPYWSLPDILKIKLIWAGVEISHRYLPNLRVRQVSSLANR